MISKENWMSLPEEALFHRNWPSFLSCQCIFTKPPYFPLKESLALYLKKLELSLIKDNLSICRYFQNRWYIFTIVKLSSLGKGWNPSLEQTWNSLSPRMPRTKFDWIHISKQNLRFASYIFTNGPPL